MKKNFVLVIVSCVVVTALILGFYASSALAQASKPGSKAIKWRAVAVFSPPNVALFSYMMLIDEINKRAKGELIIDFLGGPEVMPPFDQALAVKRGVFNMTNVFHGAYRGIVPEAAVVYVSRLSIAEERERGMVDLLREIHAKSGLFYLGRVRDNEPENLFFIWTKKKVEKPDDLAGIKIGTNSGATLPFLKALKAYPTVIRGGEAYTALEKGVIDGYATARSTMVGPGMHTLVNYVIDHGFYAPGGAFLINLDSWNDLPQHLKKLIEEIAIKAQEEGTAAYLKLLAKDKQKELDAGVNFIKFSPADAERYIETAYGAYWKGFISKYPEIGQRFRKMIED